MTRMAAAMGLPAVRLRELTDPLRGMLDRVQSRAGFRRWAAAFPLTRPVARRRARALFDIVAGFVYSQVLFACVELRLFEMLAEGPQALPELARRLDLPEDGAARLLLAAASLRLVARRGADAAGQPRFGLGALGTAMVDNAGLQAMVAHHGLLYRDLADPVALLRGARATALGGYWPYAGQDGAAGLNAGQTEAYTALMAASQPLVAAEVLDAYRFARHRVVLDVGGGDGAFLAALAERAPRLERMLFDLPAVAERARARFERSGLAVGVHGGDFRTDALPYGADLVTLVRVVHDHDDDVALAVLRAAHAALAPGGTVLVAEPMAATAGAEPVGDAYFGLYLWAMGSGRARNPAELAALLVRAGFDRPRLLPTHTPLLTGVMVAQRGADDRKNDTDVSNA
jgi:demethylspheroidene O-methyltransferase